MDIELDFDPIISVSDARQSFLDDLSDKFEDEVLRIAKNEAEEIYVKLEKLYESFATDEAVIESLEVNDYKFLADGTIFNV